MELKYCGMGIFWNGIEIMWNGIEILEWNRNAGTGWNGNYLEWDWNNVQWNQDFIFDDIFTRCDDFSVNCIKMSKMNQGCILWGGRFTLFDDFPTGPFRAHSECLPLLGD